MKALTLLEDILLTAIVALEQDAYGVSIRKRAEDLTGKRLMYGTLYNALDQLLRKGYITKTKGQTSNGRGGRPRIYYVLTESGKRALRGSYDLHRAIWDSILGFLKEKS